MTLFREQEAHFGVFWTIFAPFWSFLLRFTPFSPILTPLETKKPCKMTLLPHNFPVYTLLNMVKWTCISLLKGAQLLLFGHFCSTLATFSHFGQFWSFLITFLSFLNHILTSIFYDFTHRKSWKIMILASKFPIKEFSGFWPDLKHNI